ncbi:hypothetical protein F5Y15DRAFT_385786 [Xylariaceae sp. FL0016]|nr:hypothetical protein F5Y15DRAFT_385786 [Xylariaceae sp. FL0016]
MSATSAACASTTPTLPIPDTYRSAYSCAVPAGQNLRLATCCWYNGVQYVDADRCFEFCHIPADWYTSTVLPLAPFDVGNTSSSGGGGDDDDGVERLRLSMKACLEADDFPAVVDGTLKCQANSDDTVPSSSDNGTATADECALAHPALALGGIIPKSPPSCGMAYDEATWDQEPFTECCDWAPRRFANSHCSNYCYLPHGNAFNGDGDLTDVEAVDSFKRCLMDVGGGEQGLEGISCQWNESMRDLKAHVITTDAYLKGAANRVGGASWGMTLLVTSLAVVGVFAI